MIYETETTSKRARSCEHCGNGLQNPGFNKNYVACFGGKCEGKLREWGEYVTFVYSVDDGRDANGRFHHVKSKQLIRIES